LANEAGPRTSRSQQFVACCTQPGRAPIASPGRPLHLVGCSDHEGLFIPVGTLFEVILGGIDAGLGTGLILIAGGSADADRADLHLVRGHDR
jgi:hypothetical protein